MNDHLPPLSYAPDGLYESDVDTLIAEYFTAAPEPKAVTDKVASNRHVRRLNRRNIGAACQVHSAKSHRLNADDTAA